MTAMTQQTDDIESIHFDWSRRWVRRGGSVALMDGGFPTTSSGRDAEYRFDDQVDFSEMENTPCLVLLGEPGMGKTDVLKSEVQQLQSRLKSADRPLVLLEEFRAYGASRPITRLFEDHRIQEWAASDHILYLFFDGLDESTVPGLAHALLAEMKKIPSCGSRLRLRLSCRGGMWDTSVEDGLLELFGKDQVGVYELVSLRRDDVESAAAAVGLDATQFLAEIKRQDAESFAMRPLTLKFLLRIVKREGQLPSSLTELYRNGLRLLCDEANKYRASNQFVPRLSPVQLFVVAARIAAYLLFSGKAIVRTGPGEYDPNVELKISDLAGGTETDDRATFDVTEADVRETLALPLFSNRLVDQRGFDHQSFLEYLAAWYWHHRNLSTDRKLSLIRSTVSTSLKVVPQLSEVAGWMASLDRDVFQALASDDPQILLRCDTAACDPSIKVTLIAAILNRANSDDADSPNWNVRQYFKRLQHADLAKQLTPWIVDNKRKSLARELAIEVADVCRESELGDALASVALDRNERFHLRLDAAKTVSRIGNNAAKSRLADLITDPDAKDRGDDLKGVALETLWPEQMKTSEMLAHLQWGNRRWQIGGPYWRFVRQILSKRFEDGDVPDLLDWMRDNLRHWHSDDDFKPIWDRAWKRRDNRLISDAINRFLLHCLRRRGPPEWLDLNNNLASPDVRRQVGTELVALSAATESKPHGSPFFVFFRAEDFDWLAERLDSPSSNREAEIWADLINYYWDRSSRSQLDKVLELAARNPQFKAEVADAIEPVMFGSKRAAQMQKALRTQEELEEAMRRLRKPTKPTAVPIGTQLENNLKKSEGGDFPSWHKTVSLLCKDAEGQIHAEDVWEPDITKLPGWETSDTSFRDRLIDRAQWFIEYVPAPKQIWHDPLHVNSSCLTVYRSLLLLQSLRPRVVANFSSDTWRKWTHVVLGNGLPLGMIPSDDTRKVELVQLCHSGCSDVFLTSLAKLLDLQNAARDLRSLPVLDQLTCCWDDGIAGQLFKVVLGVTLKPDCLRDVLSALLAHGHTATKDFCAGRLKTLPKSGTSRLETEAVCIALLESASDSGWPLVWPLFKKHRKWTLGIIERVTSRFSFDEKDAFLRRLPDEQLADLFEWCCNGQRFSFDSEEDDPDDDVEDDEAGRVTLVKTHRRFMTEILDVLSERGTLSSLQALQRLRNCVSDRETIVRLICRANYQRQINAWAPISVKQLHELAQSPKSRLLRDEADLLQVVLESLDCLGQRLQGETPIAFALWDEDAKGKFQPKDEACLATFLKSHLKADLEKRGIIALREVVINDNIIKTKGKRTDIYVTAIVDDPSPESQRQIRLVIEVKGCWHPKVRTAMNSQLVPYLRQTGDRYGLYLVGWYRGTSWHPSGRPSRKWTIESATKEFTDQAKRLSQDGQHHIESYVIDVRLA